MNHKGKVRLVIPHTQRRCGDKGLHPIVEQRLFKFRTAFPCLAGVGLYSVALCL
ncbi:MAG: hypothetical protein BWX80_04171 [Candidatus Hydrogenedentes bacterium ADurb.Bin101]|nr:MAG: hypothetical protein BWX80_04171 [Candidatus Hydrogenedentes bacterium ADurb.Bin101]